VAGSAEDLPQIHLMCAPPPTPSLDLPEVMGDDQSTHKPPYLFLRVAVTNGHW
jgi:hypothetical protein